MMNTVKLNVMNSALFSSLRHGKLRRKTTKYGAHVPNVGSPIWRLQFPLGLRQAEAHEKFKESSTACGCDGRDSRRTRKIPGERLGGHDDFAHRDLYIRQYRRAEKMGGRKKFGLYLHPLRQSDVGCRGRKNSSTGRHRMQLRH